MENELQALRERVARAERQLAMLRVIGLAVFIPVAASLLARPANTQAETTRVKAPFEVVAADGKPLLRVDADQGRGSLRLYNPEGRYVARLSSQKSGGRLEIINKDSLPAALLDATPDGGGNLAIFYKGSDAATLQPGGMELWSVPEVAQIHLRDKDGKPIASLWGGPDVGSKFSLYDKSGTAVFAEP